MNKKILVIDNATRFMKKVKKLLESYEVGYDVVKFQKVKFKQAQNYEAIVLSGGGWEGEVSEKPELFKEEIRIKFLRDYNLFYNIEVWSNLYTELNQLVLNFALKCFNGYLNEIKSKDR